MLVSSHGGMAIEDVAKEYPDALLSEPVSQVLALCTIFYL